MAPYESDRVRRDRQAIVCYAGSRAVRRGSLDGRVLDVATEHLGDEMARGVSSYRRRLAETPVELDVNDEPTVNVVQGESWVELRLRYLVHPRRGTRVRNALYEAILDRFNDHPERVKFPVNRNR